MNMSVLTITIPPTKNLQGTSEFFLTISQVIGWLLICFPKTWWFFMFCVYKVASGVWYKMCMYEQLLKFMCQSNKWKIYMRKSKFCTMLFERLIFYSEEMATFTMSGRIKNLNYGKNYVFNYVISWYTLNLFLNFLKADSDVHLT